jgi:iron(III) transport system substrate-binding protein
MQQVRSLWAARVAMIALVLVIAACSGGGATAAPSATSAGTAGPSSAGSPAASSAGSPATSAGTGTDMAALVAAATAEGALTFYTVQTPATNKAVKTAFEAKYPGITVTVQEAAGSELKTKFLAELQSGAVLADVVAIGEYTVFEKNAKDLVSLSSLPDFAAWPEKYRNDKYILTSIQAKHILVNTKLVKPEELTSYRDIIDPKYKGLIGIPSPRVSRAGASWFSLLAKRYGDDLLTGFAANQPLYQPGGGNIVNLISAGEKGIGFPITASLISPALASGAPLASVELDPEGGAEIWSVVTAKAPHPNAARLMLDFLMSRDGQQAVNGDKRGSSVLPDVPTAEPLPKFYVPTDESITDAEIDRVSKLMGVP